MIFFLISLYFTLISSFRYLSHLPRDKQGNYYIAVKQLYVSNKRKNTTKRVNVRAVEWIRYQWAIIPCLRHSPRKCERLAGKEVLRVNKSMEKYCSKTVMSPNLVRYMHHLSAFQGVRHNPWRERESEEDDMHQQEPLWARLHLTVQLCGSPFHGTRYPRTGSHTVPPALPRYV